MNRTLSRLDALLEKRKFSGSERLASLNRSIESIERKLGNMGNPNPGYAAQPETLIGRSKIEELEQRVRELSGGYAHQRAPAQHGYANQPLHSAAVNNLTQPGNPLEEIAERKRALNMTAYDSPAQSYGSHNQYQGQPNLAAQPHTNAEIIEQLGEKIEALRSGFSGELNSIQNTITRNVENESAESASSVKELERIAQGIRKLQKAPQFDPSAFDALHNELDSLRMSLGATVRHEDFNSGINDLGTRLDQISNEMASNSPDILNEIKMQLDLIGSSTAKNQSDQLMKRVNLIGEAVSELSGPGSVSNLDKRLDSLVEAVDSLANKPRVDDTHGTNLDAIEARLDEIARGVVAVSVSEQNQNSSDAESIERLENRIIELGQGLEQISQKNDDEQFVQLTERIDAMAANIDAMGSTVRSVGDNLQPNTGIPSEIEQQLRVLASHLDNGAEEKQQDDRQLSQLVSRIDGLTEKVGVFALAAKSGENIDVIPVSVTSDTSRIEEQLQQLADRLDTAVDSGSTNNQLQNLELQIADIAEKLGSENSVNVDIEQLESRLVQIDQSIAASQDFTLEAATRAAQSAIEMMDDQNLPNDLISALAEDLRTLQNASNQSESRAIETFDTVKSTLNTVVDRLGQIEARIKDVAAVSANNTSNRNTETSTPSSDQTSSKQSGSRATSKQSRTSGANSDLLTKISQAPPMDPSDELQADKEPRIEDNRLLEPGSGAPDVSALVRSASEKFSQTNEVSAPESDKTDFVAAARRAAQVAVSEVTAIESKISDKKNPSAGSTSRVGKIPRRPVIIAAAAILMAVIAFAGTKFIAGNNNNTAVVAVAQPEIKGEIAAASSKPQAKENSPASATDARPAVSNQAPETALATKQDAMGNGSAPVTGTSGFSANAVPKETGKFTALPAPGKVMSETKADDKVAMATPEIEPVSVPDTATEITSAPLPPAILGPIELRQAAAKGNVRAQHEIALRYSNGVGVKRDLKTAATWYERAAAREFAPAQYRLGSLYEKGLGVKRDLSTALTWYSRAAELGNARAMHNLAVINAMGATGEPNMAEAVKWFTKAADLGVKDSQFNLGILYGQGMGVKQDLAASYKWFAIAAKTGDVDSAKKRDEVANVMDPKALDKARITVREWRPEKLVELANRVVIPENWRKSGSVKKASLSRRDTIRQTQDILNKLGYKVGPSDGVAGPKTRRAVLSFQKKAGLKPTGVINADLVKALKDRNI